MTTPSSSPPPLNAALATISRAATTELAPIWQLDVRHIRPALFDTLPALLDRWGTAAAAAAADWYDEKRAVADVAGRYAAAVEPLDERGAYELAGWAAQALDLPEPDVVSAQYRAEGGIQKQLVNAANKTVTGAAAEDPQARGYMRQTRPGACKFCVMVASRGGVYTKTSVTFACHMHCFCEALPAWGGKALPVGPYKPSDHPSTPEERAQVREWIKRNL